MHPGHFNPPFPNQHSGSLRHATSPPRRNIIYTERQGDLAIQIQIVNTFLEDDEVWYFTTASYKHLTTIKPGDSAGRLQNGGLSQGADQDPDEWDSLKAGYVANFKHCKKSHLRTSVCFAGSGDVGNHEDDQSCRNRVTAGAGKGSTRRGVHWLYRGEPPRK